MINHQPSNQYIQSQPSHRDQNPDPVAPGNPDDEPEDSLARASPEGVADEAQDNLEMAYAEEEAGQMMDDVSDSLGSSSEEGRSVPPANQINQIIEVKFPPPQNGTPSETLFLVLWDCPCCSELPENQNRWLTQRQLVHEYDVPEEKVRQVEEAALKELKERETRKHADDLMTYLFFGDIEDWVADSDSLKNFKEVNFYSDQDETNLQNLSSSDGGDVDDENGEDFEPREESEFTSCQLQEETRRKKNNLIIDPSSLFLPLKQVNSNANSSSLAPLNSSIKPIQNDDSLSQQHLHFSEDNNFEVNRQSLRHRSKSRELQLLSQTSRRRRLLRPFHHNQPREATRRDQPCEPYQNSRLANFYSSKNAVDPSDFAFLLQSGKSSSKQNRDRATQSPTLALFQDKEDEAHQLLMSQISEAQLENEIMQIELSQNKSLRRQAQKNASISVDEDESAFEELKFETQERPRNDDHAQLLGSQNNTKSDYEHINEGGEDSFSQQKLAQNNSPNCCSSQDHSECIERATNRKKSNKRVYSSRTQITSQLLLRRNGGNLCTRGDVKGGKKRLLKQSFKLRSSLFMSQEEEQDGADANQHIQSPVPKKQRRSLLQTVFEEKQHGGIKLNQQSHQSEIDEEEEQEEVNFDQIFGAKEYAGVLGGKTVSQQLAQKNQVFETTRQSMQKLNSKSSATNKNNAIDASAFFASDFQSSNTQVENIASSGQMSQTSTTTTVKPLARTGQQARTTIQNKQQSSELMTVEHVRQ